MLKPTSRKKQSQTSLKKTASPRPSAVLTFASPKPKKVKRQPLAAQPKQQRPKERTPKKQLFSSLSELPHRNSSSRRKRVLKTDKNGQNGRQDSTNSTHEQAKPQKNQYKHYAAPNGEYFGPQDSYPDLKSFSTHRSLHRLSRPKLTRSLEKMVKEYRRIESEAESEESSVNSELSERELRRLRRMQLVQRMELMEEIVSIEETLQRGKGRSKKHRQH